MENWLPRVQAGDTTGISRKLTGALAARSPGLRLGLSFKQAFEIERHRSANEIFQGRLVDFLAFVDVDGAPDVAIKAGVE